MHKGCIHFIKHVVLGLLFVFSAPGSAFAQQLNPGTKLMDIQQSYERGELKLEEAAIQQFEQLKAPGQGLVQKCAAPAFMFFDLHHAEISPDTRSKILAFRQERDSAANSLAEERYISASGKFEIVYQTSGYDSVSITDSDGNGIPDYVELVAESADSSYREEVTNIGFKDPIPDGTTYKVNIVNLSFYGYTDTGSGSGGSGPLTEIYIENDFENFPQNSHPEGDVVGAVYATMAHEFKHAIEYAQNQWRSPSGAFNWAEMDATLMEEVVYDDVNDYYNYIKESFNSSSPYVESIFYAPYQGTPGSYYHVSWMIYFSEYYGNDLWRQVWELIELDNFLSIDDALRELLPVSVAGEDFATAFTRNHLWHFASGSRSGLGDYGFDEKRSYPNANLGADFSSVPVQEIPLERINTLAAQYYEVTPQVGDEGYVDVAVDFDSTQVGLGLLFYLKDSTMDEMISYGENKAQLYLPSNYKWQDVEKLGIVVSNYSNNTSTRNLSIQIGKLGSPITIRDPNYADLPDQVKVYQNYPNPFNPVTNIAFDIISTSQVKLDVYDVTGRKVRSLLDEVLRIGSYEVPFDAAGMSSGVYLYRLQINDGVFTKKMMLIK